jgi:transposase
MSDTERRRALEEGGHTHPAAEKVSAALFATTSPFFLAADKVQVKYEMLRAHAVDGVSATTAAATHGYSRAAFYLAVTAFEQVGMTGLLDERAGRRGPLKLTPAIVEFLAAAPPNMSGAELTQEVARHVGVELHRRPVERARRR